MQTTIEATQAIIYLIRRDCFARLYFFINESHYILSLVRSGSLEALYALSGWCWEVEDFWESEAKIISQYRAIVCSPGRRIKKLFKAMFHGKLKKLNCTFMQYCVMKLKWYIIGKQSKQRINPYIDK